MAAHPDPQVPDGEGTGAATDAKELTVPDIEVRHG